MRFSDIIALSAILATGTAVSCDTEQVSAAVAAHERFAPDVLRQDGRITFTPTISPDGRTLYFTQADCALIWECPQQLFRSRLGPDGWEKPELVRFSAGERVEWPSFSPDGRTLYFSWATSRERHAGRDVYEDFDLYRLDLTNPAARPEAMDNPDINRLRADEIKKLRFVNNETAPSLTKDGDLYFWTERLDGIGNRDVYVAPAAKGGGFEKARPLPAPINSRSDDAGVWVHPDGRLLLINYADRGGEGGSDIFVSTKSDGAWSTPVSLGPTVNTRYSEFAARITPDGKQLLFTSDRPVGTAKSGLFQVWSVPAEKIPALQEALDRLH